MKPVKQTVFGWPYGNCFNAMLASLLEVSVDAVPNFGADAYDRGEPDKWADYAQEWLEDRGMSIIWARLDDHVFLHNVYHGMSVQSPRGLPHAVVGKGGAACHDPHPDDTFGTPLDDDRLDLIVIADMGKLKAWIATTEREGE